MAKTVKKPKPKATKVSTAKTANAPLPDETPFHKKP
jgi:hypothetical protein